MGFIFNKPVFKKVKGIRSDYDGYETALENWAKSTDDYERALAINLRCDYRVSRRREKNFREVFENCGYNLANALDSYFDEYIDSSKIKKSDFCRRENLIFECSPSGVCKRGFNPDEDLVTVMNLNGLRLKLKDADNRLGKDRSGVPLWDDLIHKKKIDLSLINDAPFDKWLFDQFTVGGKTKNGDSPDVINIISAFFEIIGHDLTNHPEYHQFPVWVTKWSSFEKTAFAKKYNGDDYVDRWNQVVGVNRKWDTWQIIVKYPANAVKCLYRPSQLDGGKYPQHFPPPPLRKSKFLLSSGGHTVDLASKNSDLLNEFIHQPILLKPEYYQNKIGRTRIKKYQVRKPRLKHFETLSNVYYPKAPDKIKKWMTQAI